jgi:hypothetical protein
MFDLSWYEQIVSKLFKNRKMKEIFGIRIQNIYVKDYGTEKCIGNKLFTTANITFTTANITFPLEFH